MTFDDETLMAYADGELDPARRAAIETAITADADLAERVAQHRILRSRLQRALDPVLTEPMPERLLTATRGASSSAHSARPARVIPLRRIPVLRWSWPQSGALAAGLVLGLLLGPWLLRTPAPIVTSDGVLLAGGSLARALSQQLASTQPAAAPVRIGVSFRSHTGDYCRVFMMRGKEALAGLACHEQGSWHLEALVTGPTAASESGTYRPAASELPPAVTDMLDVLIAGEPLDASAEAAARDRGWSR